jgi:hypothetical protein
VAEGLRLRRRARLRADAEPAGLDAAPGAELPRAGVLRLGSWTALVRSRAPFFDKALPPLFRGCFHPAARSPRTSAVDAVLYLLDAADTRPPPSVRPQPLDTPILRRVRSGAAWEFATRHVAARVVVSRRPVAVFVWLQEPPPGAGPEVTLYHFTTAVHKILLLLGRMYLHAGAVRLGSRVSVFVGDKGTGKSTVCLALARAGATVLADDHVLLTRARNRYLVSGCLPSARVTSKTETWLFDEPLSIPPEDVGGLPKKEFPIAQFFHAEPHRDRSIHCLFFLQGSDRLELAPLSPPEALRRLVQQTAWSHPLVDGADQARYLHYLADLVTGVPAVTLGLGPNLDDLAELAPLLAHAGRPAHERA